MAIDPSKSHVLRAGRLGDHFVLEYDSRGMSRDKIREKFRDLSTSLRGTIGHERLTIRLVRGKIRISVWFNSNVSVMFTDGQFKQYIGMTEAVIEERLGHDPARDDGIE